MLHQGRPKGAEAYRLLIVGLLVTMALDVLNPAVRDQFVSPVAWRITNLVFALLFLAPQILLLFVLKEWVVPRKTWRTLMREASPLIAGLFTAWVTSIIVYAELSVAGGIDESDAGLVGSLVEARVSQEYFAQISQLIPLLAIAVFLEVRPGSITSNRKDSLGNPLQSLLLVVIVIGEISAIFALMRTEEVRLNDQGLWLEYGALVATVYAVTSALVALVVLSLRFFDADSKG